MTQLSTLIESEIADFFAGFGSPGEPDIQSGEAQRLLTDRINRLLAAEAQEPVAWIVHARGGDQLTQDSDYVANAEGIGGIHSTPLYADPQPVGVPDDDKTNMLCDSAYVNGLQAGFSMGQMNQEAEYAQTVEHYRKGIREYRAARLEGDKS